MGLPSARAGLCVPCGQRALQLSPLRRQLRLAHLRRLRWVRLVEVRVDIEPFIAFLLESSAQFDIPPSTRLPLLMTLQRLVVTRVGGPRLQEEGCPLAHVAGRAFPECWIVSGPLD